MKNTVKEILERREDRLIKELPSFPWERKALKKRAFLPRSGERRARLQNDHDEAVHGQLQQMVGIAPEECRDDDSFFRVQEDPHQEH